MIPDIGIMIGVYILTRMVSFLTRKETRSEAIVVKVMAVVTVIVTLAMIAELVTGPSSPSPPLR
jgi:hypothetical protein